MALLRISTVALIFMVDAIIATAKGNSMYTLKPTGTAGITANVASLLVASIIFFTSPRGRRLWNWVAGRGR